MARSVTLLACVVFAWPALGQTRLESPPARGAGAALATRSVSRYLGLERALQDALARHDATAVRALLDDAFELRTPVRQDTESADEWLRHELPAAREGALVRELSVHEADDMAIVSFLVDPAPVGRRQVASYFVTDVWRQSTQRLLFRSVHQAVGASPKPSRPNGRE